MSDPGIVTVSCLLLTTDVVRDVPFHTTTELLLKLPPFTVRTKPAPPAVALLGESELTEGVDGQEQETAGSKKIANAPKRGRPFIVEPQSNTSLPSRDTAAHRIMHPLHRTQG